MEGYERLKRRILMATVINSLVSLPFTAWLFGVAAAASVLVGALAGLLYLWLLARSVSRLGVESRSLSKSQLLVPVVLVVAAAKLPQLEVLPAVMGFLLYKPALVAQAILDA